MLVHCCMNSGGSVFQVSCLVLTNYGPTVQLTQLFPKTGCFQHFGAHNKFGAGGSWSRENAVSCPVLQTPRAMPDPYDYECGSILGMKMLWDEHSAERRAVLVATDTLLSIVRNVCDHPNEAKFRRLKKTSNVYSLKIAPMPLAEDLLAFCGFEDQTEEDGSKVLRLPDAVVSESTERCQTAVSELQVFRAALQKSFPLSLVLGASLCRMGSGAGAALEAVNTLSGLLGSYVGVYFSASWCPPCRQFTPLLASTYQSIRAAGKAFEVVFVSLDRDQASYEEYFKHQVSWPFALHHTGVEQ